MRLGELGDEVLADVGLRDVDVGDPGGALLGAGFCGGASRCEDGFGGLFGGVEGSQGGAEAAGGADDEDVVAHVVDVVFVDCNLMKRRIMEEEESGL